MLGAAALARCRIGRELRLASRVVNRPRSRLRFVAAAVAAAALAGCSVLVDVSGLSTVGSAEPGSTDARPDTLVTGDGASTVDGAQSGADAGTDASAKPCTLTGTVESKKGAPNAAVDDNRIGTIPWSNPTAVSRDDDLVAGSASMSGDVITHWLLTSDFALALPPRSLVRGFVVLVDRSASYKDEIGDYGIALVKAGNPGTTKSQPGGWPTVSAKVTYGSASDTWGQTFTVDDVNAKDFGVAIAAKGTSAADEKASVDYVEVTVFYERCVE